MSKDRSKARKGEGTSKNDYSDTRKTVEEAINAHGHGLQYATFAEARRLYKAAESSWIFEANELPFCIGDWDGRVDLVLKHKERPMYLCVEFKRTNPDYRRWVFARGGPSRRNREAEYPIFSGVHMRTIGAWANGFELLSELPEAYTVALIAHGKEETKDYKPGDNEFEDTVAQAYAGVAGVADHIAHGRLRVAENSLTFVIPVIVTTAELLAVTKPLTGADHLSGAVKLEEKDVRVCEYLFYQYSGVPSIVAQSKWFKESKPALGQLMDSQYLRTVVVTSPQALKTVLDILNNWAYATPQGAGEH